MCGQNIIYNCFNFLNPARRPQSRKGRLAADALRQRREGVNPAPQSGQRDGVKEYYYAQEIDLFSFFCFGDGIG